MFLKPTLAALLLLLGQLGPFPSVTAQGYGCEADVNPEQRRDCYPEPDSNEQGCRARDCVWCPPQDQSPFFPWCFFPEDEEIPSTTLEPLPGFNCETGYLPPEERVDCALGESSEYRCRMKGCTWCPDEPGGPVPWCYIPGVPSSTGYFMVGEPVQISNGMR